ncbi:MAG: hypothetical protein IKK53_01835 [Ruminiclostridium sp.]|nr:hypothetical protein [Ruminiclostridium sp.]
MRKAPSASMIIGIAFSFIGFILMCVGAIITIAGMNTGGNSMLFLYIFGGIGLLFFVIGLPFLFFAIRKKNDRIRLLETGVQAEGVIKDVVINRQVTVNGRHPYKAECEVTDPATGEIFLYSSESVMKKIDYLVGRKVTVYYDSYDRSRYYVDIDSAEADYSMNASEVHDFR